MRRILFFAVACLLAAGAQAADPAYQPIVDKFFDKIEKGKADEAIDELYGTNKWIDQQRDMVQNVKTQFAGVTPLVGKYRGRELVGTTTVGGRLVHVTYLVMYDRQPLRFEFQFYRPQNEWTIYSFSFDAKWSDEIEAGARAEVARGGN